MNDTTAADLLVFLRNDAWICEVASHKVHTTRDLKLHKSVGVLLGCGRWFHRFKLLRNISFNIAAVINKLCYFFIVAIILKRVSVL
jgi:hypothetical protein